jgi:hypothetical protein
MDDLQEHNSKQASHTNFTIEEWDADELLQWIQQQRPKALSGDKLEKFKDADIDGTVFMSHAGDMKYFHEQCGLPVGTSERLSNLARELAVIAQRGKDHDTSTGRSTDQAPLLFYLR